MVMIKLTDSFLMGLGLILLVPLFVSLNQIIINELMPNSFDGSDWLSSYCNVLFFFRCSFIHNKYWSDLG